MYSRERWCLKEDKVTKQLNCMGLMCHLGGVNAEIIHGVDFPAGATSFADTVYLYSPGPRVGGTFADPMELAIN